MSKFQQRHLYEPNNCVLVKIDKDDPFKIDGVSVVDFQEMYDALPISGTVVAAPSRLFCYDKRINRLRGSGLDAAIPFLEPLFELSVQKCRVTIKPGDRVIFRYHYHVDDTSTEVSFQHERLIDGHYLIDYHDIVAKIDGHRLKPVGEKIIAAPGADGTWQVVFGTCFDRICPGTIIVADGRRVAPVFSKHQRFFEHENLYELMPSDVLAIIPSDG